MKAIITDSAFSDLQNIIEYYKEQVTPDTGIEFVSSIIKHCEILETHPDIGRMVPEFEDETIREIIHPPFRIVYLRKLTSLQIIRVWRSERMLRLPDNET